MLNLVNEKEAIPYMDFLVQDTLPLGIAGTVQDSPTCRYRFQGGWVVVLLIQTTVFQNFQWIVWPPDTYLQVATR